MSHNDRFGDDRLKKDAGAAARGPRDNADVPRVQNDGSTLSDTERRRLLRQNWVQEVLPTPPAIPGFHLCWVSTTSTTDPLYKRMQLGYQPVKASEVKGLEQYTIIDEGQFNGCVACNEMLLFKVPDQLYQDLMRIYHYDIPLEQEQGIKDAITNTIQPDADGNDLRVVEGDFNKLGQPLTRNPTFA